ncbi:MAG: endolytic transglycosylase MltG [Lachnospiraceae bacterium]|nr:endolytic transglycosylase MltG [Lachnospiraceae bacterium]
MSEERAPKRISEPDDTNPLRTVLNMGNFLLKVGIVAIFLFALFYGSRSLYRFGYTIFTTGAAEEAPGHDIEVTVLPGMSRRSIGTLLKNKGVIADATVFYVQSLIYGYDLQPGTYILNSSETIEDILMTLAAGTEGS